MDDGKNSDPNPNPNPNPNPYEPKLAFHFLRALARINQNSPKTPPSRRSRSIRRAAYASMAVAAGPRRAWSRALLRRLCNRSRRVVLIRRRVRLSRSWPGEPRRSDDLRTLVPGSEAMDFCSLLEETADYVQCLSSQVKLMQSVVDSASL